MGQRSVCPKLSAPSQTPDASEQHDVVLLWPHRGFDLQ
jgi:hypothetical protein